jgi:hypothetical protein
MATLEQLHSALVNADQAGDTDAATALATEIKRMSSARLPCAADGTRRLSAEADSAGQNLRPPVSAGRTCAHI